MWLESDRRFGFRFVKCFLPGEFSGLTLYRVRKLMRELGIRGCTPNARKRATIPDPKARPRPDLVRRDFTSPVPTYKLVGDITYLRTGEGWLYLVDGHRPQHPHGGGLVALRAHDRRHRGFGAGVGQIARLRGRQRDIPRRPRRPVHQQASGRMARDNDVRLSCSRTGNCHDNAVAEFIEAYYNRRRPRSTIGYKVPAEAMAAFFERTEPKLEAMPMAA